jgi:Histidine kinase-, DNA gyrase B-, and HSP90-like ATPase
MTSEKTNALEKQLIADLRSRKGTKEVTTASLQTDEKVIARITDGIYRQPGSALRELLANAFDADATSVTIDTDVPRFSRVVIRDDGRGMSLETLAHIVHHIGGSAKRSEKGRVLELVDPSDTSVSPKGRRLIGKIGIGLFSVAQLTRHFQIVSKVKGEDYRSIADIVLSQFTEIGADAGGKAGEFEPGTVKIWSEKAEDLEAHGTEIVLLDLKPQTKRLLRSHDIWALIREQERLAKAGEDVGTEQESPDFHIGEVDLKSGDTITRSANVPWAADDEPTDRFRKLIQAVPALTGSVANPELDKCLDNYLQMVWTLSLSLPLAYVEKHPFDTLGGDDVGVFELSNLPKGQATKIDLGAKTSVRKLLKLSAASVDETLPFDVYVDGLKLSRPITLYDPIETKNAIKRPQLFVGKWKPDLTRIPADQRGGVFAFEAYLCWAPKVVPKEHQGVLIRINDATGTLFDETFLKYKVSEQNRLKQVTAEIFVSDGLDDALNIDRESFNYSHPHYLLLQQWLHGALRQLANTLKKIAKELNAEGHKSATTVRVSAIAGAAKEEWTRIRGFENEELPSVEIFDGPVSPGKSKFSAGEVRLQREVLYADVKAPTRRTAKTAEEEAALDEKVKAIYQILAAHGVFEKMKLRAQQDLMRAIVRVLNADSSHE